MSVWNTFSAGLHMVQEKLEHVLEDPEAEGGEEQHRVTVDEETDGAEQVVTSLQPKSPHKHPPTHQASADLALQEAEQQIQLIHQEYKKLMKEKEEEIVQLSTRSQQDIPAVAQDQSGMDVLRKELTAHKEMVSELRKQLVEKENEFQELNNKAESKFNRLKSQAKAKITTLNKELEKIKAEHGVATSDSSLQVLDSSLQSLGEEVEGVKTELQSTREELSEAHKVIVDAKEEKERLQQEMADIKHKFNISEVCLMKEQEARVCLELKLTETEEKMEEQVKELHTSRIACEQLQNSLSQEQRTNQSHLHQLEEMKKTLETQSEVLQASYNLPVENVVGGVPNDSQPLSPLPDEARHSRTPVMAAGDKGSLVDMEQEISQLEAVLRERDEQLSSFKTVLEQKKAHLVDAEAKNNSLTEEIRRLSVQQELQQTSFVKEVDELKSQLALTHSSVENITTHGQQLQEEVQRLEEEVMSDREKRSILEQGLKEKEADVIRLSSSLEEQVKVTREKTEEITRNEADLERLRKNLQDVTSANEALNKNLDGDRRNAADKLAQSLQQTQELEVAVSQLHARLQKREMEVAELTSSQQALQHRLSEVNEMLQKSESVSHSAAEQHSSELAKVWQELEKARKGGEMQVASLEEKLHSSTTGIQEQSQQKQQALEHVGTLEREIAAVKAERDDIATKMQQMHAQLSKTLGALEFAQKELSNKDSTIQSLSQALEEKKTALTESVSLLSTVKSENAEKATELLQRIEQVLINKSSIEKELSENVSQLKTQHNELENMKKVMEELQLEHTSIREQFELAKVQLQMLKKEKEAELAEKEMLHGHVSSLSLSQTELQEMHSKQGVEVAQLQAAASKSSAMITDLQQKLRNSKLQLTTAIKSSKEEQAKQENLKVELERYAKENRQMKEQFDSAVKLMERNTAEQTQALSQAKQEIVQKEADNNHLRQQVTADSRTVKELRERLSKISADYKISTDRCRLIEHECQQLRTRVGELEEELGRMQQTVVDTAADRESLTHEHQALLSGMQEHEGRMLEMTNQLAELARDKQSVEMRLREVSRQLSSSEDAREQVSTELAELRQQAREWQNCEREKQVLLEDHSQLEREKAELQASNTALLSQVQQLQSSTTQLQQTLQESLIEAERQKAGGSKSVEAQKQLEDIEISHLAEINTLQQKLQDEVQKRELAEKSLQELKSEVAIGMEDVQSMWSTAQQEGQKKPIDYLNMGVAWTHRLIKNPNIVLTRLLRATPQTKLLFLAYFVLLHLLILYIIIL